MREKATDIDKSGINRRRFLGGSAAAVSAVVLAPRVTHTENGAEDGGKKEFSGPKIRLGIIGCGQRGS